MCKVNLEESIKIEYVRISQDKRGFFIELPSAFDKFIHGAPEKKLDMYFDWAEYMVGASNTEEYPYIVFSYEPVFSALKEQILLSERRSEVFQKTNRKCGLDFSSKKTKLRFRQNRPKMISTYLGIPDTFLERDYVMVCHENEILELWTKEMYEKSMGWSTEPSEHAIPVIPTKKGIDDAYPIYRVSIQCKEQSEGNRYNMALPYEMIEDDEIIDCFENAATILMHNGYGDDMKTITHDISVRFGTLQMGKYRHLCIYDNGTRQEIMSKYSNMTSPDNRWLKHWVETQNMDSIQFKQHDTKCIPLTYKPTKGYKIAGKINDLFARAGLSDIKEAVVFWADDHIEVWNPETYEQFKDTEIYHILYLN
ncbi:MAG: hypothetical protein KKF44_10330 [Nanoarchaeota archaeon]|nr:hypothetical protein [Nanoarchaeota archaeon]